ncbi:Leucine-rich repeat-containing protein 34 [Phlyctochytrium planicorne]|nr:Leucine-rich repeat-containing protein 34 [Phlyctochytrium planicorne]
MDVDNSNSNVEDSSDAPGSESGGANSMQVIDFLDSYVQLCSFKNVPVITSLQNILQEAIDGGALPKSFELNGNREELRARRIDDDYVEILMTPMAGINFIQELSLSFNEIKDRGAKCIANFIKDDKYIRILRLNSNSIGIEGGMAIAKALNINETLQVIDLSDNPIGDGGMEFAAMLQNDIMMHLSRMLKVNKSIKYLNLAKFGITDWTMTDCIASAIKVNTGLRSLDLSCNRITRDGGVSLCQALYKHAYIGQLSLSCCAIQDQGAEAVSVMLLYNKSLSRLYLDHNGITGKGLRALAHSIQKNHALTHISLWGNHWDVDACEAFSPLIGGPVRKVQANEDSSANDTNEGDRKEFTRLKANDVDVVLYSVEGVLKVARNTQFVP